MGARAYSLILSCCLSVGAPAIGSATEASYAELWGRASEGHGSVRSLDLRLRARVPLGVSSWLAGGGAVRRDAVPAWLELDLGGRLRVVGGGFRARWAGGCLLSPPQQYGLPDGVPRGPFLLSGTASSAAIRDGLACEAALGGLNLLAWSEPGVSGGVDSEGSAGVCIGSQRFGLGLCVDKRSRRAASSAFLSLGANHRQGPLALVEVAGGNFGGGASVLRTGGWFLLGGARWTGSAEGRFFAEAVLNSSSVPGTGWWWLRWRLPRMGSARAMLRLSARSTRGRPAAGMGLHIEAEPLSRTSIRAKMYWLTSERPRRRGHVGYLEKQIAERFDVRLTAWVGASWRLRLRVAGGHGWSAPGESAKEPDRSPGVEAGEPAETDTFPAADLQLEQPGASGMSLSLHHRRGRLALWIGMAATGRGGSGRFTCFLAHPPGRGIPFFLSGGDWLFHAAARLDIGGFRVAVSGALGIGADRLPPKAFGTFLLRWRGGPRE